MADIEPPSFSLGLDFDFEPSQAQQPSNLPTPKTSEKGKEKEENDDEDEEFDLRVSDSESDSPQKSTLTRLRRLRRGGPSSSSNPISTHVPNSVDDDDIEDFSDEDDNVTKNNHLPPQHHSSCSSSKLPLSGCGVLMRPPESSTHDKRGRQDSSCPSTSLGSSKGKTVFSNLTASPLRRFQLLDSESDRDDPSDVIQVDRKASSVDRLRNNKQEESEIQARFKLLDSESEPDDDPSGGVQIDRKASSVDYLTKNKQKESEIHERFKLIDSDSDTDDSSDGVRINREASSVGISENNKQKEAYCKGYKISHGKSSDSLPPARQKDDLWKDFFVNERCSVPTPAFDEFCEEYFKPTKSSKPSQSSQKFCSSEQEVNINNGKTILQSHDPETVVPPSHRYFLHDDLRIQRLVRSRLPYFCPLGACGDTGSKSHNASSSIDYMSQFGQDGAKQRTGRQVTAEKNTKRGRKKTKNSNIEDTSGNWIDPKQTARTPTDAGRRRVHADGQSTGQSAGHWFTAENGKKVYVTKTGKELTGKLAYTQYRKESGKGFKSKKKGAAKKK